jgi:hypothetical protein
LAAAIQPDLEALQAREVGGEQARGLAERVMASVIGRTQELPLLAPEAPAAEPLSEKNIMAVLRLLSQKQRGGYELLGQTGLTPAGLRRVIERIDAMGMLFIHGSLQPRDIGSAQVSLKPSASGTALLISRPWPGTDTLSSHALDTLALLQTKVRFGYELMSGLELDRPRLENLVAELQATGLIHISGDFRGPGVDNTLVSILPSNMGKVKAVLERKRLLKLLLPVLAAPVEALPAEAARPEMTPDQRAASELSGISQDIAPQMEAVRQGELSTEGSAVAAEGIFQRLLGRRRLSAFPADAESLPDPTLKRLNPKIAVTPVSEHLPDVIFVKFLRGTTLETMLGILARNGVRPELYADNGDGFRARVALSEVEAGLAAGRLAVEGQVEIVEVNRKVYDMLRQGGAARVEVPGVRASAQWPNKADYALAGAGTLVAVAAFTLLGAAYALGLAAGGVVVMAAGVALWLEADYQKNQKERGGRAPSGRDFAFKVAGSFLAGAGFTAMAVGLGAQILLAPFREAVTVVLASLGGFAGFQSGLNYLLGVHAPATLLDGLREILSGAHGSLLSLLALGIGGVFWRGAPSPAGAAMPVDGRGAKRLHDSYKDWGELLGGLAGMLLALGVGAWAFAAASASLALPVALFWGAVAALAVGMLTTLGLASLGRDIGDRFGEKKVDRIHLDFLDRHRGRIEAVPGVASVRYQISIPGLSDAVTPADGPLFVVVLDGTAPYETVRRDLKAAVPELDGFPVFFE